MSHIYKRTKMKENTNKVWEGRGNLWNHLTIYEASDGTLIGDLRNSTVAYIKDTEIVFPEGTTLEEAIAKTIREDGEYLDHLTMYAEEG